MCQALATGSSWKGIFFYDNELEYVQKYLRHASVVVLVRTFWSFSLEHFVSHAKKLGIPTLFDVDDLVFDVTKIPVVLNSLDQNASRHHIDWFGNVSRIWFAGTLCDATIGTNDFLCKRLQNCFQTPSFALNNFLNHEQLSISQSLFNEKQMVTTEKKGFTIGYFSGTPSHIHDFRVVAFELDELLKAYPELTLEVAGYMQFPKFFKDHLKKKRVVHTPFVDFVTLQKNIAQVDLNIVPLQDNEFTNCKSELKFFEAAIVGTTTCATPTFTFQTSIDHGKTGYLCHEGEWFSSLENIYKNPVDFSMRTEAQKYCVERYSPENQRHQIEKVLESVLS